jgi:hypothetical protein
MLTLALQRKFSRFPSVNINGRKRYCEIASDPVSTKVKELRRAVNRLLLKVHPGLLAAHFLLLLVLIL